MKNDFVKIAFVVLIGMVGTIKMFYTQKIGILSDVALANVEALADEEWGEYSQCYMDSNFLICSPFCVGVSCICE